MSRVGKVMLMVLVISLGFTGIAFAGEGASSPQLRAKGKITYVDLEANSFGLHSHNGEDYRFMATRRTRFRSPNGSLQGLVDLEEGMRALVVGTKDEGGAYVAQVVVAANLNGLPDRINIVGEITSVTTTEGSFSLKKRDGEIMILQTNERTRFKSREGSINGIEDLEEGMAAIVVAIDGQEGGLLALVVAAGYKDDLSSNLRRYRGEITDVVPGQGTFTLQIDEGGQVLTIQSRVNTRFRSLDGSLIDIQDLKKGMKAVVIANEQENGTLLALLVTAGNPQDRPERPNIEALVRGLIVSLGDHSITLKKQNGDMMTFSVDGSTKYKSRDGSVNGFDDLQEGMVAIIAATELGKDQLKAILVGVGQPSSEKPLREPETPFQGKSNQDVGMVHLGQL